MPYEAEMVETEHGLRPADDGWFVVNAAESTWFENPNFGASTTFEGKQRFPQIGINIHIIQPGQPACMYHREDQQEDFLVLSGECLLLIEEEERPLEAWDFVHCPAETDHVFVGAGDGPCAILMIGHRDPDTKIVYPESALAQRHGAGVEKETPDPRVAYEGLRERREIEAPWPMA